MSTEGTRQPSRLEARQEIIRAIEQKRGSKLITLVLSDRPNATALITDDAIRPMQEQLEIIGHHEKIDLFLYTRGGVVVSTFRIAKLIREYCEIFSVLVPFRAHSGGTQICLGANKIVMGRLAELSPVDPSTANPFNPIDQRGRPIPISVEDVAAYLELARERAGLVSETSKVETFRILTGQAPALALGNVARVYREIRRVVEELLSLHMDRVKEQAKIEQIKRVLTEEYTHEYYITCDEAKRIGLPVEDAESQLEQLMNGLLADYDLELHLREPFDAESVLGQQAVKTFYIWYGMIESSARSYVALGEGNVSRPTAQPQQINVPGMPGPVTVVPHPSSLPVSVKFKLSRWVELSQAPNGV